MLGVTPGWDIEDYKNWTIVLAILILALSGI